MNREVNDRKLNRNTNKRTHFDKDHVIPKEECATLTPYSKDFWISTPSKGRDSILRRTRSEPKHAPPSDRKVIKQN